MTDISHRALYNILMVICGIMIPVSLYQWIVWRSASDIAGVAGFSSLMIAVMIDRYSRSNSRFAIELPFFCFGAGGIILRFAFAGSHTSVALYVAAGALCSAGIMAAIRALYAWHQSHSKAQ